MSARLFALSGPVENPLAVHNMSDFEAGLAFLGVVNQLYPGIRFGQLPALAGGQVETMGFGLPSFLNPVKAFDSIAHVVGDVKDGVGDVLKDSLSAVGSAGGSTVRLLTNEKVVDGATKAYGAVASGGLLGDDGSLTGLLNFISTLGSNVKDKAAAAAPAAAGLPGGVWPWALGFGGLALVLVLSRR